MSATKVSLSVLRLSMAFGETSAPYNQFSLPLKSKQAITLCSYLPATLTPPAEIKYYAGDGTLFGFLRVLRQVLKQQTYDVIHVHDVVVSTFFLLVLLTQNLKAFFSIIYTVHTSYDLIKLRNRLLLIPTFLLYRKVICCSKASYASFPPFYRWLAGDRLTYIQNGMDIARVDRVLTTKSTPPSARRNFTLIVIGRLIDLKNPLTILNAFAQSNIPDSRLVFVGAGPLVGAIQAQAKTLGVADRVELTGLIPRDEVYQRINAADLFVSTSYGEGLPIAVLEAMACRKPVVLSDIPPHREIAGDCDYIALIGADDTAGFAQAIKRCAAYSPEQRKTIGKRCRKLVEDSFSLANMHRGYAVIYNQVSARFGSQNEAQAYASNTKPTALARKQNQR